MIDWRKVGLIVAVLTVMTIVTVTVDDWWRDQKAAASGQIAQLQRGIATRDLQIKGRDAALADLKRRDAVTVAAIAKDSAQLATTSTLLAAAKAAIDSDAALHAGLVPIVAVHELEIQYDAKVASCEQLGADKDTRIDGLLDQIANQATTRAALDTNAVADAKILKDTVAILKPPWPKRFLSWIGDHGVTFTIGAVAGAAAAVVITKK